MTQRILALDPGNVCSALVELTDGVVTWKLYGPNPEVRLALVMRCANGGALVIEAIESYGMAVGATVFETCFESGRFAELWLGLTQTEAQLIPRRAVKLHLCNSAKAKDANVRQAVMDRYGSTRAAAIGTKRSPGPLYGISGDMWAALAVAITIREGQA